MSRHATKVRVPCLYRRTWQDGFGARGWKLAGTANDPEVIASTAATGERIPTSVFVHDILDHSLCGLGPSGHRNEAVALLQLAARTGADPTPDFAQMVDEDLLQGRVLGETFRQFLPPELTKTLPAGIRDGKAIVERLQAQLGPEVLRKRLIAWFFELGREGAGSLCVAGPRLCPSRTAWTCASGIAGEGRYLGAGNQPGDRRRGDLDNAPSLRL
jgi:hypothetical protein